MKGKDIVKSYQKIWDKYQKTSINAPTLKSTHNLLDRGFVFQFDEGMRDIDVLFIGINPSYNEIPEESKFYTKEQALNHSYFKPFERIEKELKDNYNRKISWTHLDLLVFRETKQSFINDTLMRSENGINFVLDQLDIARSILEYLNPKVIVISNTQARTFLGADRYTHKDKEHNIWMGYNFFFDKEIGTKKIVESKLDSYCFFTSMLSGQRALDNGSRERLIWHINHVFENL